LNQVLKVEALIDTGATRRNYISTRVAEWLSDAGALPTSAPGRVCTALNECATLSSSYHFVCQFNNNVNNTSEKITIDATVLDSMSNTDLIIGLQTIIANDLVSKTLMPREPPFKQRRVDRHAVTSPSNPQFPGNRCGYCVTPSETTISRRQQAKAKAAARQQRAKDTAALISYIDAFDAIYGLDANFELRRKRAVEEAEELYRPEQGESVVPNSLGDTVATNEETHDQRELTSQKRRQLNCEPCAYSERELTSQKRRQLNCELCALTVDKSVLLDPETTAEEISEPSSLDLNDVTLLGKDEEANGSELPGPDQIFGSKTLREGIQSLCMKYHSIFSSKVRDTPATVAPLEIEIDEGSVWKIPASRRGPRPQSHEKMAVLKEMVENLLRLRVIRVSRAEHASQVLLVVKKNTTKLRFCIDYRELNEISKSDSWPIPNIGQLLNRIGDKHAKFFAVMDLTSGYHQAPLSEASKKFTAFVTPFGLFEWNRVPMGLKAAGSYFQRTMCHTVLAGLILNICECYLDDVITFGDSEDDFLANLEAVFTRLRDFNVTLNPAKCRFGMSEIEYVGHVINDKGLTFTRDKLDSVVNFPKPVYQKEMKSFLGLANYFRLHIRNHSDIVEPLNASVNPYKKNQKLGEYSPAMEKAFADIKQMIDNCPTLYFFDPEAPVFLQTDASNHGIGAYLFQVVDGIERPVEFLSKSFTDEQTRWSTPEQEAYAIFYALRKWDHLLSGVKFTLQTDHKNLIYTNTSGSAKVKRWKMLMQEYDFNIEHIAGEKNVVADAFSRLCHSTEPPSALDMAVSKEFIMFLDELAEEDRFAELYLGDDEWNGVEQLYTLDDDDSEDIVAPLEADVALPQSVYDSIESVHNQNVGHFGVRRTIARLKHAGLVFPNLRPSVEKFIKECALCQKMSQRKVAVATLPFTLATTVAMQVLNIDTIGPLPEDSSGYQYILTIIDKFSRWVSLFALRTVEAEEATDALLKHCGIFGCPRAIDTDNGTQFKSVFDEVVKLIGAKHNVSIAHSHEENAMVERANKEVLKHLRGFMFEQTVEDSWSSYLPFTQRILNKEVHEHLGVSAAQIIFGAAIDLDRGLIEPNTYMEAHSHENLSEYVNKLIKAQKAAIKFAAEMQTKRDIKALAARTAALSGEVSEFRPGTQVLIEYPNDGFLSRPRPPHKLLTNLRGPLLVISNEGAEYTLRDPSTVTDMKVHISRMREFFYDKERVDPLTVVIKDTDQFIVESVINHRGSKPNGKIKKASELQLLIKWVGYEKPEWHPWHGFTANSVAHSYMRDIPHLKRFIPKHYR
jgi:hypothetical protein